MRFTASREHSIGPITLMRIIRSKRPASISSRRALRSTTPALLTSASMPPKWRSISANMKTMSVSLAASPWTAKASPPAASMRRTTSSAASLLEW